MGWKAFKDVYNIKHIVCITDKGLCIGSGYVHDLAVIDLRTGCIQENEAFDRFLVQYYQEVAAVGCK